MYFVPNEEFENSGHDKQLAIEILPNLARWVLIGHFVQL
jgi:hypothetical protein